MVIRLGARPTRILSQSAAKVAGLAHVDDPALGIEESVGAGIWRSCAKPFADRELEAPRNGRRLGAGSWPRRQPAAIGVVGCHAAVRDDSLLEELSQQRGVFASGTSNHGPAVARVAGIRAGRRGRWTIRVVSATMARSAGEGTNPGPAGAAGASRALPVPRRRPWRFTSGAHTWPSDTRNTRCAALPAFPGGDSTGSRPLPAGSRCQGPVTR